MLLNSRRTAERRRAAFNVAGLVAAPGWASGQLLVYGYVGLANQEHVVTTLVPVEGQCDDLAGGELAGDIVDGQASPWGWLRVVIAAVASAAPGVVRAAIEFRHDAPGRTYLSEPSRGC